jgi:hypothetical protein
MAAGPHLGSALIAASVLAVSVHPGKALAQAADACVMSPAGRNVGRLRRDALLFDSRSIGPGGFVVT